MILVLLVNCCAVLDNSQTKIISEWTDMYWLLCTDCWLKQWLTMCMLTQMIYGLSRSAQTMTLTSLFANVWCAAECWHDYSPLSSPSKSAPSGLTQWLTQTQTVATRQGLGSRSFVTVAPPCKQPTRRRGSRAGGHFDRRITAELLC